MLDIPKAHSHNRTNGSNPIEKMLVSTSRSRRLVLGQVAISEYVMHRNNRFALEFIFVPFFPLKIYHL